MIDIWEWFTEKKYEYLDTGDEQRFEMADYHHRGYSFHESDPRTTIAHYQKGKSLAKALHEPWWEYLYDVWLAITYEADLRDLPLGLKQSLHCVHEARKPILAGHPWRTAAFNTLLICYIKIDPYGHAQAIRESVKALDREIGPEPGEHRYIMMRHYREFLFATQQFKRAEANARRHLAMFDGDGVTSDWYIINALIDTCHIAWLKGDLDTTLEFANRAQSVTRRRNSKQDQILAEIYQALVARQRGNNAAAKRIFNAAVARFKALQNIGEAQFYDCQCWFHELGEDLTKSLAVRDDELERIKSSGQFGRFCDVHIKRCEILGRLGRLTRDDVAAARAAAEPLKMPKKYLARIQALEKRL